MRVIALQLKFEIYNLETLSVRKFIIVVFIAFEENSIQIKNSFLF